MQTYSEQLKQQILEFIFRCIPKDNCAVFLFGSFAQSNAYSASDIDIGIVCNKSLENSIMVKIKEEMLKVKTLRDIDIVDFTSLQDKDFLRLALKEVKVWHQTRNSRVYLDNLKRRIKD